MTMQIHRSLDATPGPRHSCAGSTSLGLPDGIEVAADLTLLLRGEVPKAGAIPRQAGGPNLFKSTLKHY